MRRPSEEVRPPCTSHTQVCMPLVCLSRCFRVGTCIGAFGRFDGLVLCLRCKLSRHQLHLTRFLHNYFFHKLCLFQSPALYLSPCATMSTLICTSNDLHLQLYGPQSASLSTSINNSIYLNMQLCLPLTISTSIYCDLEGRKINFTSSKTLVGWLVWCGDRPKC